MLTLPPVSIKPGELKHQLNTTEVKKCCETCKIKMNELNSTPKPEDIRVSISLLPLSFMLQLL